MNHAIATSPLPPGRPRQRRRAILGLRVWLAVILLIGGGLGWFAARVRPLRRAIAAVAWADGSLTGDEEAPHGGLPLVWWNARQRLAGWLGVDPWFEPTSVQWDGSPPPDLADHLSRFSHIRSLSVRNTRGMALAWDRLGPLAELRFLYLREVRVNDDTLAALARLPNVEHLELERVEATPAGFAALTGLASLEILTIDDCPGLNDPDAARLFANLPRLQSLNIVAPDGRVDAILAALAQGKHAPLAQLRIFRADLRREDLDALAHLRGLENLDLSGSTLNDRGLAALASLPRLRECLLNGTSTTDVGLAALRSARLQRLEINSTRITDAGLADLARLPDLRELCLLAIPGLTDTGLRSLRAAPRLRRVDLGGPDRINALPGLTEAGLADLRMVVDVRTTFVDDQANPTTPPTAD